MNAATSPASRRVTTLQQSGSWCWTGAGAFFFVIAVVGVYLPGVPTTGPLLLGSYMVGKGNPALKERLIQLRLFDPYRGYLDGSQEFTRAMRCVALVGMWSSIAVSCTILTASPRISVYAIPACLIGGVIGTFVILVYRLKR